MLRNIFHYIWTNLFNLIAMKLKYYLFLSSIFFIFAGTSCPTDSPVDLVDIELTHFDYSGEKMIESEDPIKKEAYVLGVRYLVKYAHSTSDTKPQYYNPESNYGDTEYIENYDGTPSPKIYCNTDLGDSYPAGSDITHLFSIGTHNDVKMDLILVLKDAPPAGTYSFKVRFYCKNNTIAGKDSTPVTLY